MQQIITFSDIGEGTGQTDQPQIHFCFAGQTGRHYPVTTMTGAICGRVNHHPRRHWWRHWANSPAASPNFVLSKHRRVHHLVRALTHCLKVRMLECRRNPSRHNLKRPLLLVPLGDIAFGHLPSSGPLERKTAVGPPSFPVRQVIGARSCSTSLRKGLRVNRDPSVFQ